jgi:hypothetical protein
MKNNILKFTAVAAVLLAVTVGTAGVFAKNATSGPVSAGTSLKASVGLAVPAGYTVMPANDNNRSDDRIVQLENLTIQSTSASVPGTIYASRDMGGPCREYSDMNGASGSKIYPCPMAPTVLYQIAVESDTILLLKNRARATIGDFAVGDRINVFGFLDGDTSGVQALIMRDLDKPVSNEGRYVQLNNLTVATGPASDVLPTTFRAARKGIEPCMEFSSISSAKGVSAPCPMGVDISVSSEILNSTTTAGAEYRPFRQYYNIQVTEKTKLVGLNRQSIKLGDIQPGDTVNIYGRYIPGTRMVEALIVRNLSASGNNNGVATLVVNVNDIDIVCVTTPCGLVNGARVDLNVLRENDQKPTFVSSQVTVNGQVYFSGLKSGLYYVTVTASGYPEANKKVVVRPRESNKLNFSISKNTKPKPTVTSSPTRDQ